MTQINELMCGDLVKVKIFSQIPTYEIHQIKAEDFVRNFNIEGIPLTPEILDKNGFVMDGHCAYIKGDVTVYPATNKDHFTDIDHPVLSVWKAGCVRELNIRCDYVHILQQALRLCGLTELANNFKIE